MSEEQARAQTRNGELTLEQGWLLSQAAQKYVREAGVTLRRTAQPVVKRATGVAPQRRQYISAATGRSVVEKPEELTQLRGDLLVPKDHPRIRFRGRMDDLQARVVSAQVEMEERGAPEALVRDLDGILDFLRQITRSEVLDLPMPTEEILGLSPAELRAQSHDPKKHFGLEPMLLPHRSMGLPYARLNELRAQTRLAEEEAVAAFARRTTPVQRQILQGMNRLSSAFHILMCRLLSGHYGP